MKNEIYCDSRDIAKKFGKQHQDVLKKIRWLTSELKKDNELYDLLGKIGRFQFTKIEKTYRGKTFTYYEMGKKESLLLAMYITGVKALKYNMMTIVSMLLMEEKLSFLQKNTDNTLTHVDYILNPKNLNIDNLPNSKQLEQIYRQKIILNFEKLFPSYNFIKSEYTLEDGDRVDILAEEKETKKAVIIEIKIGDKSGHKQLRSYAYNFDDPILIHISHKLPKKQIAGITYISYSYS